MVISHVELPFKVLFSSDWLKYIHMYVYLIYYIKCSTSTFTQHLILSAANVESSGQLDFASTLELP